MGFSLVGNSGDQTTNTTTYDNTASLNPQLDLSGASGGVLALNISPLAQNGSTGEIDPSIYDYYAPVDISSVGSALGDAAVAALSSVAQAQSATQGTTSADNTGTTGTASTLSSLFSGDAVYYILAAIVIFFLAESK